MSNKQIFCIKPWVHLHINSRGMAQACCISGINYGNVNQQPLEELWHNEKIVALREKFSQNMPDKRCQACLKREEAGHSSLRTEANEAYGSTININNEPTPLPIYWDVRFSNVCNFKCRTCWHGNSSKWFDDALALKTNVGNKAIIKAFSDKNSFFNQWAKHIHHYKEVYFAGGEPLVTEEHYEMLQLLLAQQCHGVKLKYNTNLSVLDFKKYDLISLWKNFTNLQLNISIDHVGKKAEYIRSGLNWGIFLQNFERLKNELPHAQINITPTVSVFNVLDIAEIHRFFYENNLIGLSNIELNILDRPSYYNIRSLPFSLKKLATERILNHVVDIDEITASKFLTLNEYMIFKQENGNGFCQQIKLLDTLRNENFSSLYLEYPFVLFK